MKKVSYLENRLRKVLLSSYLLFGMFFSAQAQLGVTVATTQVGNEVYADFLMYNFTDMISFQYTISWDETQMEFVEVSEYNLQDLNGSNFGLSNTDDGFVTTSWFDATLSGITVPTCQSIFTLKFELTGAAIPNILIGSQITPIEVLQLIDGDDTLVNLIQNSGCDNLGFLTGNVFNDADFSCAKEAGESGLEDWKIQVEGDSYTFYQNTDADGNFNIFLSEGNYDVSLILPENNYWGTCTPTLNLDIVEDETTDISFAAQALVSCPALNVDLSAPFLRRCFPSYYVVNFCNDGTVTAEDAYVEIEFDEDMEVVSSSVPWTTVNGNIYTFPVGDIGVGECGYFNVEVLISCEAELGATHCSEATIYPNIPCTAPNPFWDGSSIQVEGECNGDEVVFTITNVGDDMTTPSEFVIIEDDMMAFPPTTFQLAALESTQATLTADGTSYRIEVAQTENHPGLSMPNASVEGCVDGAGTISLGFVGQFPQDDLDPWIDIDCQENIGSYDPNDKIGYPLGYGQEHYIEPGTEIEYRIRFQNTGTDTAFNISILDTLSPFLDPATVRLGASSHPYEFNLSGEGVLEFKFPWIMLPDSTTNLDGSNGFVTFTIRPRGDTPLGTVVENSAAIYFDFNDPVITNTYFHTVDKDFIMQEPNAVGFIPFSDVQVTLTPNPSPDGQRPLLLVDAQTSKKLQFQLFDLEGKMLFVGENTVSDGGSLISLPIQLQRGTYLVQVTDAQNHGTTLKLFVR